MKDKFLKMLEYSNGIRSVREARKAAIAKLREQQKKYDKQFAKDWIEQDEKKIAELQEQERAQNQEVYEKLLQMGRELIAESVEKAKQPIDHSKLESTMRAIDRGNLNYKQASDLAAQFRGSQNVLEYLKSNFEAKGIHSNIDELIYSPEFLEGNLRDHAYHFAWQDGTSETFRGFLDKFAHFEGVELPKVDTLPATVAAARKAAGLPESQDKTPQP